MKLYRISTALGDRWLGTQADAKTGAKQLGASFEAVDVPTMPKEEFIRWLNEYGARDVPAAGPVEEPISTHGHPDPLIAAELAAVAAQRKTTMSSERQLTTDSIVAFILEEATVAQTCAVFEALGSVLKERLNAATL